MVNDKPNENRKNNISHFNQMMIVLASNLLDYKLASNEFQHQHTSNVNEGDLQSILDSKKNLKPDSKLWDYNSYRKVLTNYNTYNNDLFPEASFYKEGIEKILKFIYNSHNNIQEFNNFDRLNVVMNILLSYCHNVRITFKQLSTETTMNEQILLKTHQNSLNFTQQIENNQKLQSDKIKKSKTNLIIVSSVLGTLVLLCIINIVYLKRGIYVL